MSFLRLGSAGNLSGANGPHGLVGNNNLAPVLNDLRNGSELAGDHLDGDTSLTLLERLTAAQDHGQALVERSLRLGGDEIIRLGEDSAALRVSEKNPLDVGVLELLGRDLAGVGAIALVEDVLGGDLDLGAEGGLGEEEVERGRGDDDL